MPTDDAPALSRPAIRVACPTCGAPPGTLCTSHGGTRVRRYDVHQARTAAYQAATYRPRPACRRCIPPDGDAYGNCTCCQGCGYAADERCSECGGCGCPGNTCGAWPTGIHTQ